MRLIPTLAVLLALAAPAAARAQSSDTPVVADTLAARFVGRVVTVEGPVARVKISAHRRTIYLNFRRDYPEQSFSAWIPDSLAGEFPAVESLAGKVVRVTGTVWMQDEKWPAITLTGGRDLVVVPDSVTR